MGVLATVLFVGMAIAHGQGVVNVDTPDLDKAIHAMEVQSEETGREMVGEVIQAEVDFLRWPRVPLNQAWRSGPCR